MVKKTARTALMGTILLLSLGVFGEAALAGSDDHDSDNNHDDKNGKVINYNGDSNYFGGKGGSVKNFSAGGNANATANTSSAASANGGGNNVNVKNIDEYESDIFDARYYAPDNYLPKSDGYTFKMKNKMGAIEVGCPVGSTQFSVGAWLGGIGFGSNSDDLPEDCKEAAGLLKTSYYDNLMFHGVEGLHDFDQHHARCVAVAEAYKHNYGRTKSVSSCVQASMKKKQTVKPVVHPLPPVKQYKPIVKPAPLPKPMPLPTPLPKLPDDADKKG